MATKPKAVGWALDNANVSVKTKPRRPYTPYNIFYLLERELMVQEPKASSDDDASSSAAPSSANPPSDNPEDKLKLPARYKGIVMGPQWYDPNCKEKRKHRKTHGKDLTEQISRNWANIDKESKDYCTALSEIGRRKYKQTMSKFNASRKIIELKQEKSEMMAARARDGPGQHLFRTPPRTKSSRLSPPAPPIHTVTPDRYRSNSHHEHSSPKRQPPVVVTPPYNPYDNRRPMYYPSPPYYGHGNVAPPPPLPGPPPPMPSNVAAYYRPHHHAPVPPPMPSNSDYHSHYAYSHDNTRCYQGYPPHAHGYNNYYLPREHNHPPPQEYASGPKPQPGPWNYDSAAPAGYNPMVKSQPVKTKEEQQQPQADHSKSSQDHESELFKLPIRKKSSTDNDDMTKIQSMMSFDSIKSHQMRFTLSFEEGSKKPIEGLDNTNISSHQGAYFGGLQDEEESILGLLRDDLVPFDTGNGISFQLSWDRSVN
eukprot:scaffold75397_cov67-Cyclotella_meneghiniana.AAC.7